MSGVRWRLIPPCSRQAETAMRSRGRTGRQLGKVGGAGGSYGATAQRRQRPAARPPLVEVAHQHGGLARSRHQLVEQRLELAAPVPRVQVEVGRHHAPASAVVRRAGRTRSRRAPRRHGCRTRPVAPPSPRAASAGRCHTSRAARDAAAGPRCTSCRAPRRTPPPDLCRCGRGATPPPEARPRRRRSRAGPARFRRDVAPAIPAPTAVHVVAGDAQDPAHDDARRLDQRRSAQVNRSAATATPTTTSRLGNVGVAQPCPKPIPEQGHQDDARGPYRTGCPAYSRGRGSPRRRPPG